MRITSLHLKNFKRFSDLKIQGIPDTTRLVLLVGSNGTGKSSVFDAFALFGEASRGISHGDQNNNIQYYIKENNAEDSYIKADYKKDRKLITDQHQIIIHIIKGGRRGILYTEVEKDSSLFYGRTSFRQVPRLTKVVLGQGKDVHLDSDRPMYFIDRDNRLENDIEEVISNILDNIFHDVESKESIITDVLKKINNAFLNIFSGNTSIAPQLISLKPPKGGRVAEILFKKGIATYSYNLLSAGEKEIFNILINLFARSKYYPDSIYFLDEIDLHLNAKLQYTFLKEVTENWIPPDSQLWTATHSIGFIEYAKDYDKGSIIDFETFDFDLPAELAPSSKMDPEIFNIAVNAKMIEDLFAGKKMYFVENKDKYLFAKLGLKNTIFISEANRNSVYHKSRSIGYNGLVDRDFLSDDDVSVIEGKYTSLKILRYYSIENYLYHPDNLEEYYSVKDDSFNKNAYIQNLIEEKNKVKEKIKVSLVSTRCEYPYFGEPESQNDPNLERFKKKEANNREAIKIGEYLDSDEFEIFYKSLPMKDYCKTIQQRLNIPKHELANTNWFKKKISELL